MWTGTTMTLSESLLASAMGFLIVFLVLIFLALVIIAFAKALSVADKKKNLSRQHRRQHRFLRRMTARSFLS